MRHKRLAALAMVLVAFGLVFWLAPSALAQRPSIVAPLFGPKLVRGEVIVSTGGTSTADLRVDRGVVTSQTQSQLTLQELDGRVQPIPLSSSTRVYGRKRLQGRRALVIWAAGGTALSVQSGFVRRWLVAPLVGPRLVRGEVIVAAGGSTADVRIDRGLVVSQTPAQLTLQELDGRVQAIPLSSTTHVYGHRRLQGWRVLVIWSADGSASSVQAEARAQPASGGLPHSR